MLKRTRVAVFFVLIIIAGLIAAGIWFGKDIFKSKKTGWIEKGDQFNINLQYIPDKNSSVENIEKKVYEYDLSNAESEKALVELISSPNIENMEVTFIYNNEDFDDSLTGEPYKDLILQSKEYKHIYMIISVLDPNKEAYYIDSIEWRIRTKINITFDMSYAGQQIVRKVLLDTPISSDLIPNSTSNILGYEIDGWYSDKECKISEDLTKGYRKDITVYSQYTYVSTTWLAFDSSQDCYYVTRGTEALPSELIIPSVYDDGTNGEASITYIRSSSSEAEWQDGVFYNQTGLTSVILPDTIVTIGMNAFYACTNLRTVKLSNRLELIDQRAFEYCTSLQSIHIPALVSRIHVYVFAFNNMESITVDPKNPVYDSRSNCNAIVTSSGTLMFACPKTVITPDIKKIGIFAFTGIKIDKIVLPDSITEIRRGAFSHCTMSSIYIPASVKIIDPDLVFAFCTSLVSIKVASDNPVFDSRNNCNAVIETATNTLVTGCKGTTIPSSVKTIGFKAFYCLDWAGSMTIPSSVTKIADGAFKLSGLTSIKFVDPNNWKSTNNPNYTGGTSIDSNELSDPQKAAAYLNLYDGDRYMYK